MDKPVYVIGHRNPDTDSVCSAIAYAHLKQRLGHPNVRPARPGEITAETEFVLDYFGVPVPDLLTDAAGQNVILVDHNEIGQALPHIEQARILEIWEHHRIGDLRPPEPIVVHCEPVGATATLIAEQYFAHGITPTRSMAGIMLASILSDTVGFRSPTTSEKDHAISSRLLPLADIDPDTFGQQMRKARTTALEHDSVASLLANDFKEFRIGDLRVGISQVEVVRAEALAPRKHDLLNEMRRLRRAQHLDQVILMITDVTEGASDLWFVGDHVEIFEKAFGHLEDQAVHVAGCMSRKKQVVPRLESVMPGTTTLPAQA
jgi:manganese-dependent inorganic pyrophosphatase